MNSIWALSFILVIFVTKVQSQCGVCLPTSSAACLSETEFQACFNGGPSGPREQCPSGYVCTASPAICQIATGADVSPACVDQCRQCGADRRFACLDETTFAYCFDNITPSTHLGTCPAGRVCVNTAANFCEDSATAVPDCAGTSTTTPGLCPGPGRFPVSVSTDCKQYVYCFYRNGELRAQIYTCQGTTIFYPPMQQCIVPSEAFSC